MHLSCSCRRVSAIESLFRVRVPSFNVTGKRDVRLGCLSKDCDTLLLPRERTRFELNVRGFTIFRARSFYVINFSTNDSLLYTRFEEQCVRVTINSRIIIMYYHVTRN